MKLHLTTTWNVIPARKNVGIFNFLPEHNKYRMLQIFSSLAIPRLVSFAPVTPYYVHRKVGYVRDWRMLRVAEHNWTRDQARNFSEIQKKHPWNKSET